MRMAAILGGLAFLAVACAAHASGTDDGNAGLTALQNGDNDGAIRTLYAGGQFPRSAGR